MVAVVVGVVVFDVANYCRCISAAPSAAFDATDKGSLSVVAIVVDFSPVPSNGAAALAAWCCLVGVGMCSVTLESEEQFGPDADADDAGGDVPCD